jgi:hypothetical protein
MIDLERKLLFRLTTAEGMAVAIGADVRPEVFETPLNQAAFNWAMEYWAEHKMAPTRRAMEYEFPGIKLDEDPPREADNPTEEATGWLIETLCRRFVRNQLQEILISDTRDVLGILDHEHGKDIAAALTVLHNHIGDLRDQVSTADTSLLDRLGINGADLDAKHFEPLEYQVPGLIPEGLGIMGGPPKLGKSWVAIDVGLAVACGGYAFGAIRCPQRPVLYLALEDGERRLQERSRAALADQCIPANITFITTATPNEALLVIAEFMTRHQDDKPLVLVDTLGKIKRPRNLGEESYLADYQEVGGKFLALTHATPGSTLLFVHHTRKANSDDFVAEISGTFGITGAVDFVIKLARPRLSNEALLNITGRDVIEDEYALDVEHGLWRLKGGSLDAARNAAEEQRESSCMGATKAAVLAFVRMWPHPHPLGAADIARATSIPRQTAGTNLRRLADEGLIARVGHGQFLPLGHQSSRPPLSLVPNQERTQDTDQDSEPAGD